jgi:hypothetical protein
MEKVECSSIRNRPIMQVPVTLGGGVHDGLILKGKAGAGGHRVRNDGLEIGQIRAQRWEGWESSDQRAKWATLAWAPKEPRNDLYSGFG